MNKDIKERWVKALRSGDYQQTKGSLIVQEGDQKFYCCLGVLVDQAIRSGCENIRYKPGFNGRAIEVLREDEVGLGPDGWMEFTDNDLPAEVQEWSGLDSHNPDAGGVSLIRMNDDEELSFDEIADAIEEHL